MCSHTASHSAMALMTSSVKSWGCGLVNRIRWMPSTSLTARSSSANLWRVGESGTVRFRPYMFTCCPGSALLDAALVLLGQASCHDDAHARVSFFERLQVPQRPVQTIVCVLPDGTGVEHDHLGLSGLIGRRVPVHFQQSGDALGVVLVHLAPDGANEIAT